MWACQISEYQLKHCPNCQLIFQTFRLQTELMMTSSVIAYMMYSVNIGLLELKLHSVFLILLKQTPRIGADWNYCCILHTVLVNVLLSIHVTFVCALSSDSDLGW